MIAAISLSSLLLIIVVLWSVPRINTACFEQYGYAPFSLSVFTLACFSDLLVLIGLFIQIDRLEVGSNPKVEQLLTLSWWNDNAIVLVSVGVAVSLFLAIRLIIKTNILYGLYAYIAQVIAGIFSIILIGLVILRLTRGSK